MTYPNTVIWPSHLQCGSDGQLKHFLTIEGLKPEIVTEIYQTADSSINADSNIIKNISLNNKGIVNLFFEASTRTKTTFEIAAKNCGADVISLAVNTSSTSKGETLVDTANNLLAMQSSMIILRHPASGAAHFLAQHLQDKAAVVNAGDGAHAHPTQALLDIYTLKRYKTNLAQLSVAIVGDILHSRVARSNILLLHLLGVKDIRVVAPKTLMPKAFEQFGVKVCHELKQGIQNVDVIMMLRLQKERMNSAYLPDYQEFYQSYGLNQEKLQWAKPDVLVMHPGPINRGVEIASAVADGTHSVILQQVHFGIAVRMGILTTLAKYQSGRNAA